MTSDATGTGATAPVPGSSLPGTAAAEAVTTTPGAAVYESTVTQVGAQVEAFLAHGMLIFFGDAAPEELHDMSVLHRATTAEDGPRPGDVLQLADTSLEVLAVGGVVRDNLLNLGHLDLKADGLTEAKLPGDVCVRVGPLPALRPGDAFVIRRSPSTSQG